MTEPLTPADCDLRDFAFMPLDVVRLRDSDLAIHVTGEEFRAAVLLWCAAWHQVPAASLPDDDKTLAALAGFGRVVSEWQKVRDGALRGWITCNDGRLYHPVVAEKAVEAWASKHRHAHQKLCERVRKLNKARAEKGQPSVIVPSFDEWFSAGMPMEKDLFPPETPPSSAGKSESSGGNADESGRNDDGNPPEKALKGQGQGQGYKKEERERAGEYGDPPNPTAYGLLAKLLRAQNVQGIQPGNPDFRAWVDAGLTEDEIVAGLETARASRTAPSPMNWSYLARCLESNREKAAAGVPPKGEAQPRKEPVDTWWKSDAGIERKGRELGLFARANENHQAFKDRIFEIIRQRDGRAAA